MITFEYRPILDLLNRFPFLKNENFLIEKDPYGYFENLFESFICFIGNLCLAEIFQNGRSCDSLSRFFQDFEVLTPEKSLRLQEIYLKEFNTSLFSDSQRLKGEEVKNTFLKYLRELITAFYFMSEEKSRGLKGDFIRTFVNFLKFLSQHLKGNIISYCREKEEFYSYSGIWEENQETVGAIEYQPFYYGANSNEGIEKAKERYFSELSSDSEVYFAIKEKKYFLPLHPFIVEKFRGKERALFLFKAIKEEKGEAHYIDWSKGKEISLNNFQFSFGRFFLMQLQLQRAQKFLKETIEILNSYILSDGLKLMDENRFSEAITSIESFSNLSGSFPYLDLILARAYFNIGANKNAMKIAHSIVNRDPGFSSAFELLGDLYKREGNLSEASNYYQISLKINPFEKSPEKLRKVQEEIKSKDSHKDEDADVIEECMVDLISTFKEQYFPIIGRDDEIEQMLEILMCRTKNNVLILGDSGVGKTSMVYGLVQRIKCGEIPEKLKGKKIVQLHFSPLIAGAKLRGQFEERIMKLLKRIKEEDCISFIDDIHTISSPLTIRSGGFDAISILKPMMEKGEIQVIATTDFENFRSFFEKEPSFIRNFQIVKLEELSVEDTIKVILSRKDAIEAYHNVEIVVNEIPQMVENVKIYLRDRFLPDKALDIVDRASSKVSLKFSKGEKEDNKVGEMDFAEVISELSGVPIAKISTSLKERLLMLEDSLKKRVVGQEEAIEILSRAIRTAKLNLDTHSKRPDGVFLFIGPTGVGKTELAKSLAEALFGDEDKLIRLDMSEYMEKFTYSRLVGSPPGYVGYYDQNQLTDLVRQKPYSVILIDEVEKADPQLLNIFLQIFDAGRLTDGRGKTAYFNHATIIMTSNIGTTLYSKVNLGYESSGKINKVSRNQLMKEIKRYFSPEFLNRLDEIIFFKPLTMNELKKIVLLQLEDVKKRLTAEGKELLITESATETIARNGYSEEYGARNISREIRRSALDKISELALSEDYAKARRIIIDSEKGKIIVKIEETYQVDAEHPIPLMNERDKNREI